MSEVFLPLPTHCLLRPAHKSDRWMLQRFTLKLVQSEALGFDLRIVAYHLVKTGFLGLFATLQRWLLIHTRSLPLQSVLMLLLFCTLLWAIAQAFTVILYLVLIPTEPLLNWSLYQVVECEGAPVGCAALACYGNFCVLYHLYVSPPWRQQLLASRLVQQMIHQTEQPTYLVCKPQMCQFYTRLGFVDIPWKQLSQPLKAHFKDFERDRKLGGVPWEIMSCSQTSA
ncbi:GNAT family N-acetyltransferase [Phormidium sp. CLA17]|uniref:GNAT family N-acetyltransferase n=1 Tax=Leptolyngbya sp. Cla-17 TaxID=2803751 RepID=UPI0014926F83|nr:GNAT family N-acetyltransferase [Leptolyngbya sp. Cla-17]MBM0743048.1 GNAT family N-acetyltransferase [Leptolyngbya sp. Cla-17]